MKDLIIIGAGPAGASAAVYASRKQLNTTLITKEFGGQSVVSSDIQNWIGTPHISGDDLAKSFKEHVLAYAEGVLEVKTSTVEKISPLEKGFSVVSKDGSSVEARAILIATGSDRRKLTVPGADTYEHKGVVYCASCDGPLFSGLDVAVIGGGNAGFETAAQLLAYAKSVTLLEYNKSFKADQITIDAVLKDPKMKAYTNASLVSIEGDAMVKGLTYKDTATGEEKKLAVEGVFVEIGLIPTTSFAEGIVDMDKLKRIIIDPKTQRTSVEGIWSAGDCTDVLYHQNNIASGDGVKALEDIYLYLKKLS